MVQQHNYGHLPKAYLEYHVLLTNSLAVKAIPENIISDLRQLPSSDLFFMVLFLAVVEILKCRDPTFELVCVEFI